MTGIPIHNVSNNCSTGSSGLHLARQLCQLADLTGQEAAVLVLGYDVMAAGPLSSAGTIKPDATGQFTAKMVDERGWQGGAPGASQLFGNAGREYMDRHHGSSGTRADDFAEVARINHAHSAKNPYAQFRREYSTAEIDASGHVFDMLTKLQCCPTSDGAAAAVVVSSSFLAARPQLRERAVEMAGLALVTDAGGTFGSGSMMELVGCGMTRRAAAAALAEAGIAVEEVGVVELHDCFSANEVITLEALGLCEEGMAGQMVRSGDITYGGKYVVNPSGGLISKGHPLGATGLAQAAELVWQLRGWANNRLAKGRGEGGVRWALQHNLGLGGAAVVAVYRRADGKRGEWVDDEEVSKKSGVGYNPAVEARAVTREQVERVRSKEMGSEWALGDVLKKVEAKL